MSAPSQPSRLLFLDTEFTDLGPYGELLSLALVSEDGQQEFYAERTDYLRENCSDFVVEVVLPLFGRFPEALCGYEGLCQRLRQFLVSLPETMTIACDYGGDFEYLRMAVGTPFPVQIQPRPLMITSWLYTPEFMLEEEQYFAKHPRHHALHDARAMRLGYRAVRGRWGL